MTKVQGLYDIEAVRREWLGRSQGGSGLSKYPVEYEPIKRHMRMCGDTNPLFHDPDYAAAGPYGSVIAPPPMMGSSGGGGWPPPREDDARPRFIAFEVPTPGDRFINMNTSYDYLKPVRIGDRLSSEVVLHDLYQKPIRLDPKAVWIVTETRVSNQHGELVYVWRNTMLCHRTPEEVAADPDANGGGAQ